MYNMQFFVLMLFLLFGSIIQIKGNDFILQLEQEFIELYKNWLHQTENASTSRYWIPFMKTQSLPLPREVENLTSGSQFIQMLIFCERLFYYSKLYRRYREVSGNEKDKVGIKRGEYEVAFMYLKKDSLPENPKNATADYVALPDENESIHDPVPVDVARCPMQVYPEGPNSQPDNLVLFSIRGGFILKEGAPNSKKLYIIGKD